MTSFLLLAFAPARWEPWLLGVVGGILIDIDHIPSFIRKYGFPRSKAELQRTMKEHFAKEDESTMPRLRTTAQEPFGYFILSLVAILIHPWSDAAYAIPAFWGHFILDALSVKFMPLAPFANREIYIGLLDPTAHKKRVFVFNTLLAVAVIGMFLMRRDIQSALLSLFG